MVDAIDSYVIRGVRHNTAFLRDVYVADRFRSGKYTTDYIPEEYPEGFHGVELTPRLQHNMAAIAVAMTAQWEAVRGTISGQTETAEAQEEQDRIVTVGGTVYVVKRNPSGDMFAENEYVVEAAEGGDSVPIAITETEWAVNAPLFVAKLNGEVVKCQHMSRDPEGFTLLLEGAVAPVVVRTPRQEALAAHMIPKPEKDFSKLLVSPMPGKLVSINVAAGDHVEAGQELCVVEAMKMQNVLRAERAGVVKSVNVGAGATLAVDDTIIEFEG